MSKRNKEPIKRYIPRKKYNKPFDHFPDVRDIFRYRYFINLVSIGFIVFMGLWIYVMYGHEVLSADVVDVIILKDL